MSSYGSGPYGGGPYGGGAAPPPPPPPPPAGPNLPVVEVMIDFANDPTSTTRTWVDVSGYVRDLQTERGRQDSFSRPNVGTLSLLLHNRDGRFDPTNTSGPYYPNVKPMRRIRVRCTWNSVTYNLFLGYITDWPLSFPSWNFNAIVQVQAVDALAILNQFDLGGKSYPVQTTDQRIQAVLTDCGIDASEMNLQPGISTIVASGVLSTGTTAQAHLLDVTSSESGLLFMDGQGVWTFHNRHYRLLSQRASAGVLGTASTATRYRDITTSYGIGDVWNTVTVTPFGGTPVSATDTTSEGSYYKRTLTWPTGGTYLVANPDEALNAAQFILLAFAQPSLRVPEVVTVPANSPTVNWPFTLSREISDRVTVTHVRPDGGTITGDKFVEGISHSISHDRNWTITFRLSDVTITTYWVLGDATLGVLGTSTILAY
jgi:hypothetical protein